MSFKRWISIQDTPPPFCCFAINSSLRNKCHTVLWGSRWLNLLYKIIFSPVRHEPFLPVLTWCIPLSLPRFCWMEMNIATAKTQLSKAVVQKGRQFLALRSLNERLDRVQWFSAGFSLKRSSQHSLLHPIKGVDGIVSEGKKRKN